MTRAEVFVFTGGLSGRLPDDIGARLGGIKSRIRRSATMGEAERRLSARNPRRLLPGYRELFAAPLVVDPTSVPLTYPAADLAAARALLADPTRRVWLGIIPVELLAEDVHRRAVFAGEDVPAGLPDVTEVAAAVETLRGITHDRGGTVVELDQATLAGRSTRGPWTPSHRGIEILRRLNRHSEDHDERALFRRLVTTSFTD